MTLLRTSSTTTRMKKRATLLGGVFFALFGLLGARAVYLQAYQSELLTQRAEIRIGKKVKLWGKRGTIEDRNGNKLAMSVSAYAVGVFSRKAALIEDVPRAARRIANILNLSPAFVERGLRKKTYNWLKRPADEREADAIAALKIPGVEVVPFHNRIYPNIGLAGQLIGFSDIDDIKGLSGLEVKYNDYLTPSSTWQSLMWDGKGKLVRLESPSMKSLDGDTLTLTIDSTIQNIAETALEKSVVKHKASSGMAVVMRPVTGEVLAMANYPSFNPNNVKGYSDTSRINRSAVETFEPGSTMKVFLAAAALDSGKVRKNTRFYCENGSYNIKGHTFNDTHEYEWLSLGQVIKFSSNIGVIKMSEIIGRETFEKALRNLGFGQRSGINLPGEGKGIFRDFNKLNSVEFGAVAFGQGISVTAIQLATAFGAIANNGELVKPWVVKRITTPSGEIKKEFASPGSRVAITPSTARFMKKVMATVTQEGGTGTEAALDGYTVCGKTGTAQIIGPDGTYFKDRYMASFAGFVPMEKPELVIVVIVDDSRTGGYYGGGVAGPIFREIAYKSLEHLNVAPEKEQFSSDKLLFALKSEDKQ
ncbi:MAG: penicillin-binding protein 2 [Desulfobacterales bacterium]|nr:penicillin-binding protein 2 [Desulfobacterales bacterium]